MPETEPARSVLRTLARVSFTLALASVAMTAAALARLPYAELAGQSIIVTAGAATCIAAFVSGLTAAFGKPSARPAASVVVAIAAMNALLFGLLAFAVEESASFFGAWTAGLLAYAALVAHRLAAWPAGDEPDQPRSQLSIFISYRRQDGRDTVGRIHDHLRQAFDEQRLFLDVERQSAGEDYRVVIGRALAQADVLLAIIGPSWLTAIGDDGRRRLDDPGDTVRLELEAGLARNLRVVPVLIEGASMPRAADLPESLQPIGYRTALAVRPDPDFKTDVLRLIVALRLPPELRSGHPPLATKRSA